MVKVGLVGYGSMGRNHARVLMDIDDAELVGIADLDVRNREAAARKFECRIYEEYEALISDARPDLLIIATPTMTHHDVACQAMAAGVHCLVEKPIAQSVEQGERMKRLSEEKGVILAIGHIERFNPAIQLLKQKLAAGELGRIFKVEVNRAGPFPTRIRDVGVIIDLAVHDIDMVRYLLDRNPVQVYAQTEKKIHTANEDLLAAIVTYEQNVIAQFNTNWLTPFKVRNLSITGERGLFHVDFIYQKIEFYENADVPPGATYLDLVRGVSEGAMHSYPVRKVEPLKLELENVIHAVRDGGTPLIGADAGIETLSLAFAMIESANRGEVVRVNRDAADVDILARSFQINQSAGARSPR